MSPDPASPAELDRLGSVIEQWMDAQVADNPVVATWERLPGGERRWFLRVTGEAKDVWTIRWHLRQRTLHYETYFMPAPEENAEQLLAHLLRRNLKMYGGTFAIGEEEAIFIVGHLDRSMIVPDELDRVLGSLWTWVEQYFQPAIRIGFASRFTDDEQADEAQPDEAQADEGPATE